MNKKEHFEVIRILKKIHFSQKYKNLVLRFTQDHPFAESLDKVPLQWQGFNGVYVSLYRTTNH